MRKTIIGEFLNQQIPSSSVSVKMPNYYRRVLTLMNQLLVMYFLICTITFFVIQKTFYYFPLLLALCTIAKQFFIDHMNLRVNLILHTVISAAWSCWFVLEFGWTSGGQHFLIPLLNLIFFGVSLYPIEKIAYFLLLVSVRMVLYAVSLRGDPRVSLSNHVSILFQTINSLCLFIMMAFQGIVFSTNIQKAERELILDNIALHKEAETDPLTSLPNRRPMIEEISLFRKNSPGEQFSIAIADIDFFKKVNDTYGHNCGDYTLKTLAAHFVKMSEEKYSVCRWGGEEFCFFMPGTNIDEAAVIMKNLCWSIERLPFCFEGIEFNITVTAGIEENDFSSDLDTIIERADHKLYIGKSSGRNCVIA